MELLTRRQAAERLGITVVTLDEVRRGGYLAYIQRRPGGKVYITDEAINDYLARATHPAKPELKSLRQTYRKRRV